MFTLPTIRRVLFAITLCVVFSYVPQKAFAEISCTASVNEHSVSPNSLTSMTFSITNSGPDSVNWIKVARPSSNFSLTSTFTVEGGWSPAQSESDMTLTGTSLGSGSDYSFSIQVSAGNTTADSANWTIQLSGDGGGTTVDCGGDSRGTAIEGTVSIPDPVISDIVVSDISDTQAKISWTTDVSTTTVVDYGTTGEYGASVTGDTGTSHSVSITGLTANTTYHYNVHGVRAEGNYAESGENTFTTAKQGTTITVTVSGSVTTRTVSATPTPTPRPDTTPPKVTVTTALTKPFTAAPVIKGTATDPSGVVSLEYSLDNGRSWLPVETIATPGKSSTTFEFTPESLLDDNYIVKIRAIDVKGNSGETAIGTLIIDRLPPRIGGNIATLGPQILSPAPDGSYIVPVGLDVKLTVSAVGGPTSISLNDLSLKKNSDSGLWSGVLRFADSGTYTITAHAVDGAGNTGSREIATIVTIDNGQVTSGGKPVTNGHVTVYYLDSLMKQFVVWDGSSYGQTNPQSLNNNGRYTAYLPSGTYYIDVAAPGYKSLITSIFTLSEPAPITTNFHLEPARSIRIGPWIIPIPDFRQTTASVTVSSASTPQVSSALVGHEFPYFKLQNGTKSMTSFDIRGKPTIVTFVNTWMPDTTTQMAILNEVSKKKDINVLIIVPQETVSAVLIFKLRGGYTMPIIADPDGDLVEPLQLHSLPTHSIVDRKGVISAVQSGVFNKEVLFDMIIQ
jgi:hypothetical protein